MVLKEAKWESEATGLKIAEIIYDEEKGKILLEEKELKNIDDFDYVFVRFPFRRDLVNYFLNYGFRISDIYMSAKGRNLHVFERIIKERIMKNDVPKDIIFTKDIEIQDELFLWMAMKFRNSRFFYDLSEEYALKIYKRWIREIIGGGIFTFAIKEETTNAGSGNDNESEVGDKESEGKDKRSEKTDYQNKIVGFCGLKRDGEEGKYILLFSDKIDSFLVLAKLFYECICAGIKQVEFKISLQNHLLISKYMETLGRQNISFEVVLSRVSERIAYHSGSKSTSLKLNM